jgi:hypothetical protein
VLFSSFWKICFCVSSDDTKEVTQQPKPIETNQVASSAGDGRFVFENFIHDVMLFCFNLVFKTCFTPPTVYFRKISCYFLLFLYTVK